MHQKPRMGDEIGMEMFDFKVVNRDGNVKQNLLDRFHDGAAAVQKIQDIACAQVRSPKPAASKPPV